MKTSTAPKFSPAALENIAEIGDPALVVYDIEAARLGELTREQLLSICLEGADADREQGWRDYVEAIFAAA